MKNLTKSLILGFILALMYLPPLHAQTGGSTSADTRPSAASPTTPGQAPDEVMKKLSDLVHASRYAEAQQLTAGLLLAYPDDRRLVKAKALLDKSRAAAGTANAAPSSNQQANDAVSPSPVTGMSSGQVPELDKLEYSALIELTRQAQQNADGEQQKASLKQFMSESSVFLQKYPGQMLLWQLRAASALSLDDASAGYEAGQKLLAAGAADSNDANLQLLAKLKIKGWLDKQKVEDYKKYGWILGTWSVSWSIGDKPDQHGEGDKEVMMRSETGEVEGHFQAKNSRANKRPDFKGKIRDSGEISWQQYMPTSNNDPEEPGGHSFVVNDAPGKQRYPSGWQAPSSYFVSEDKRTMTMEFPRQTPKPKRDAEFIAQHPVTLVFEKISDAQSQ